MVYKMVKKLIELGKTDGLADKLDVYLLAGRITEAEYTELVGLLTEGGEE